MEKLDEMETIYSERGYGGFSPARLQIPARLHRR
jgi:hypothetical protein